MNQTAGACRELAIGLAEVLHPIAARPRGTHFAQSLCCVHRRWPVYKTGLRKMRTLCARVCFFLCAGVLTQTVSPTVSAVCRTGTVAHPAGDRKGRG